MGAILENNELKGKLISIPKIDNTLTKEGYGADAKVTGDRLATLQQNIDNVGAFQNNGGMVGGEIKVRNADNGYGALGKNNSMAADYGTQLVDTTKDGSSAKISVSALHNTFNYTDKDGNEHSVMHEGNKARGTYNGDGTTTQRVIDTKGVGGLLLVYNPNYFSFVTPEGALVIKVADGATSWVEKGKVFYENGRLTLASSNVAFNENGTTYYYQVI